VLRVRVELAFWIKHVAAVVSGHLLRHLFDPCPSVMDLE
jgi:hypothetical protein